MIKKIQKNPVFRFLSSVKMAVPLMLVLAVIVAAGTLYESRYNADVANVIIYKSRWFQLLLALLWVNIFCSTVSRWPYKKHHLGFVVTHIGLLTLLIGAQMTAVQGIDGQLRVVEGEAGNTVFLAKNVLKTIASGETSVQTFTLNRSFDRKAGDELPLADFAKKTGITVDQYLPFARRKGGGSAPGSNNPNEVNLSFRLQSQFFDVQQTLNTENNAQLQMGPATIRLVKGLAKTKSKASPKKREPNSVSSAPKGAHLVILDAKGSVIREISIAELKKGPIKIQQSEIKLTQVFQSAMVDKNKVREGGGNANPALELSVKTGAETLREICYEKFPQFSLRKNNTSGITFQYISGGAQDAASASESGAGHAAETEMTHGSAEPVAAPPMGAGAPPMGAGGNTVEFQVDPANSSQVHVVLSKMGKTVLEQDAKIGEVITTPWMGMKLTVLTSTPGGSASSASDSANDIQEVEMVPKMPLPPSAVYLRPVGGDVKAGAWLLEGESVKIQTLAGETEVYYGMDSIELPFKLKLEKFQKVNYPGTETAMSFQSTIRINEVGPANEIKMNEPLQYEGFTLYQSSFEQGAGMQTASIFSVNHDPGRVVKYVGAIILSLGIVLFTVMRSRWYLQRVARKNA